MYAPTTWLSIMRNSILQARTRGWNGREYNADGNRYYMELSRANLVHNSSVLCASCSCGARVNRMSASRNEIRKVLR